MRSLSNIKSYPNDPSFHLAIVSIIIIINRLTVHAHKANSHAAIGWLDFTNAVITTLNKTRKGVVFILWGGFAQKKGQIIDTSKRKFFVLSPSLSYFLSQTLSHHR